MGAIAGLTGLGGGAGGTSFQGPQQAAITNPTTAGQVQGAYDTTQGAMTGQQALLQALQNQNGIGNQSQVYGQLQGIASGAVNPAQAQFAQNTQQNVANQAALMAGQRGAASNVGLIARQAAQQGAGIQQQAVGQEATQQAQNQINAIGQAGQLATTQAGQQIGQTNANVQAQQAEQQALINAQQGFNTNTVASQGNVNQGNAALAGTQMQGQQALIGGAMNNAGAAAKSLAGAGGGELVKMAPGGDVPSPFSGGTFGQYINSVASGQSSLSSEIAYPGASGSGSQALQKGASAASSKLVNSMKTPSTSNGGPGNIPSSQDWSNMMTAPTPETGGGNATSDQWASAMQNGPTAGLAQGGMTKDFRAGGKVNASSPKEKAVKGGNSYANDKIPAVLSEHEIVLPRSVTLSKDPVAASAKFVASVIAKRKAGK